MSSVYPTAWFLRIFLLLSFLSQVARTNSSAAGSLFCVRSVCSDEFMEIFGQNVSLGGSVSNTALYKKLGNVPPINDEPIMHGSTLREITASYAVLQTNASEFQAGGSFYNHMIFVCLTLEGVYSNNTCTTGLFINASAFCDDSPTHEPTFVPSHIPTFTPTFSPTGMPTVSFVPTWAPTLLPIAVPTVIPSALLTFAPTNEPSSIFTAEPSVTPSDSPTTAPSVTPSDSPTTAPSVTPSDSPTTAPSVTPSDSPTTAPSVTPSASPTTAPSVTPSASPTTAPSVTAPSNLPTTRPTRKPTARPTARPVATPTLAPTSEPTALAPTTLQPTPEGGALTFIKKTSSSGFICPPTSAPTVVPSILSPQPTVFPRPPFYAATLPVSNTYSMFNPSRVQQGLAFFGAAVVVTFFGKIAYDYSRREEKRNDLRIKLLS